MMLDDMDELSARFSALMDYVHNRDGTRRPRAQQQLLIDQLRNVLDRAANGVETTLNASNSSFIAETFAIESLLYRGTHHDIIKLRHRDLASFHVLKTLRTDQTTVHSRAVLLRREAEIGLSFRDPYLAETTTLLRLPDGRPAILQPWSGEPLSVIINQNVLEVNEITAIMEGLFLALCALHQNHYIHCDVSLSNIWITRVPNLNLRLGDFSIALKTGETHAEIDLTAAYSSDYCAPEQTSQQPAHPTMDIYAAGRVLDKLLTASNNDHARELVTFTKYLCAARPADRPQTAQIALNELRRLPIFP
jgi:type VI secretion system protein ImpN